MNPTYLNRREYWETILHSSSSLYVLQAEAVTVPDHLFMGVYIARNFGR